MSRSAAFRLAFAGLGVLGFALYIWPAFAAPVVLWIDSQIDLGWAKAGMGILHPVPPPPKGGALGHLPKPAYLLFLRGAMHLLPALGEARSVAVLQSLLLVASVWGTSFWLARRRGMAVGIAFGALCLVFLRSRDASSAVMPEAFATALLLPLGAILIERPNRSLAFPLLGLTAAVLFLARPNSGGALLLMGILGLSLSGHFKHLLLFVAGFATLLVAFSAVARPMPPGDPLHGLGYQFLEGSADYYWTPSIEPWPVADSPREMALAELKRAWTNWGQILAQPEPDRRRELVWRALHGLFGQEYYDARWSSFYARVSEGSRLLSPLLILAGITVLFTAPWREPTRAPKAAGILLLVLILGQNLLLGSNPRYVLPFIPLLFLLALCVSTSLINSSRVRRAIAGALFMLLAAALVSQRQVLDWQGGKVESAGVTLRQTIPQGSLPRREPATLHIRIAPPLPSSGAHLALSAESRLLFSSQQAAGRERPAITASLPQWILDENSRHPVEMEITTVGNYGAYSYLLFPVIPPPWSKPTRRDGSSILSPTTGIRAGSLDWWAHPGER